MLETVDKVKLPRYKIYLYRFLHKFGHIWGHYFFSDYYDDTCRMCKVCGAVRCKQYLFTKHGRLINK